MHARTISESAKDALDRLSKSPIFGDMYLAGGTALALQLGHRESYDLDFYTAHDIRAEDMASQLSSIGSFSTASLVSPHTLLGEFEGVRLSVFRYAYPLISALLTFSGVSIASYQDIAAMKLTAVCGRATKRDYIDVYTIIKRGSTIEDQLAWYEKKFGTLGNNEYAIVKALGYFDDAETDEMPRMIDTITWEEVKNFLTSESVRLGKKLFKKSLK